MLPKQSCENPVRLPGNEINEQQYWFTFNFNGRCDRRGHCLIVAYCRARRLSEVPLE